MRGSSFSSGNDTIDEAIAGHDEPRDQLKAIITRSAEMGERFHFLFHAMEEFDREEELWAMAQELNDKMVASWGAVRDRGVAPRDIPELA